MVRAIRERRKTQTRRVVIPQPESDVEYVRSGDDVPAGEFWLCAWDGDEHNGTELHHSTITSPYGLPGERMWVRETWYYDKPRDAFCEEWFDPQAMYFRADGEFLAQIPACADLGDPRWRPSIHMPRWASRITLENTGVRVERVQDISESGAFEEGCTGDGYSICADSFAIARQEFEQTWNTINAKRGYGWDANPLVWVVEFRDVTTDG